MVHALTTYPTHPKFGKAIICRLSQKTTPQVRRPVIVAIHVRVNKIHVRKKKKLITSNPASSQITKPHPSIQQYKGQKQVALSPAHHKANHISCKPLQSKLHPHKLLKNKITPKASQTTDLNCLNFKLAVPAPKVDHTQNSCPTRSSQPPTLFLHREQDPKPVEIKI